MDRFRPATETLGGLFVSVRNVPVIRAGCLGASLIEVVQDYHSDPLKEVAMVAGARTRRAVWLSVCTHQAVRMPGWTSQRC